MKLSWLFFILTFICVSATLYGNSKSFGYRPMHEKIHYKEDFFRLYTQWLYSDLDSVSRNIYFLELAYVVPFDHPIKALAPITNETQYELYKSQLMTRICTLLTQEYINYGYFYMKEHIYFFNREFFKDYLDGFDIAEYYFKSARGYWELAIENAQKADSIKGYKTGLLSMEDEVIKIKTGTLNYFKVLDNLNNRIKRNRQEIARILTNS